MYVCVCLHARVKEKEKKVGVKKTYLNLLQVGISVYHSIESKEKWRLFL